MAWERTSGGEWSYHPGTPFEEAVVAENIDLRRLCASLMSDLSFDAWKDYDDVLRWLADDILNHPLP